MIKYTYSVKTSFPSRRIATWLFWTGTTILWQQIIASFWYFNAYPVQFAQSLSQNGVDSTFTDKQESSTFYEITCNSINISNTISLGWAISPTQCYKPARSVVIHALIEDAYLMNSILLLILYESCFPSCSPFCKNPTSLTWNSHLHKQKASLWCYYMIICCSHFHSQGYSHCLI